MWERVSIQIERRLSRICVEGYHPCIRTASTSLIGILNPLPVGDLRRS